MIRKVNGCKIDCPFYEYRSNAGFGLPEYRCKLGAKLLSTVIYSLPHEDCPLRKEALIFMLSDDVKRKENGIK